MKIDDSEFAEPFEKIIESTDLILEDIEYQKGEYLVTDNNIIELINTLKRMIYNSCIITWASSMDESLKNHKEEYEKVETMIKKWINLKSENTDEGVYYDFLKELKVLSDKHGDSIISDTNLFDVYQNYLYPAFEPYKKELEKRIYRYQVILNKRKSKYQILLDTKFIGLNPYEFEEFISQLFQKMGFETEVTSKTGDYGVDVIAKNSFETIAIQVKKYSDSNYVGNVDVQKLIGGMSYVNYRADRGILVTTSDFTKNAIEQSRGNPVELWNFEKIKENVIRYMMNDE